MDHVVRKHSFSSPSISIYLSLSLSRLYSKLNQTAEKRGRRKKQFARIAPRYYPIGMCFAITSQTLTSAGLVAAARQLEGYFFTLVLALSIHGMFTLPLLLITFSKNRYRSFFSNIALTLVTAFGTSSRYVHHVARGAGFFCKPATRTSLPARKGKKI